MKTYSLKAKDINKKWLVIDASDIVLGRLAAHVATILRGKNKAEYSPHLDCGDNVIITNAEKIVLTGNKDNPKNGKFYYRHTGFPGGIKETTAGKILAGRHPERVVKKAVERMISRTPLGRKQLSNLYVYAGTEHPHTAQKPETLDFASMNRKNRR